MQEAMNRFESRVKNNEVENKKQLEKFEADVASFRQGEQATKSNVQNQRHFTKRFLEQQIYEKQMQKDLESS